MTRKPEATEMSIRDVKLVEDGLFEAAALPRPPYAGRRGAAKQERRPTCALRSCAVN